MDLLQKSHNLQKKQSQRNELNWLKDFSDSLGVPDKTSLAELAELSRALHLAKPSGSAHVLSSKRLLHLKKKCTQVAVAYADSNESFLKEDNPSDGLIRQGFVQFVCGYYDLDFRDIAHYGHANLLRLANQSDFVKKVLKDSHHGDLVGIMMTEPRGGSKLHSMTTIGIDSKDGVTVSGEKCWISRYSESRYMIIVYQNVKKSCLEAAILDKSEADIKGISFSPSTPMGLKGWSWGKVFLRKVFIPSSQVLRFDDIDSSLRAHFAYYRLLITMLVLGATAKMLDITVARLQERLIDGSIKKVRDSHLETIGNAHAVICEGFSAIISLLPQYSKSTLTKNQIALSASLKGHVIQDAYESIDKLSHMHGAAGFESASVISKTLLDARGFMFADGIQNELLRSVGKSMFMEK